MRMIGVRVNLFTESRVFWSGAYPEPIVGRTHRDGRAPSAYTSLRADQRRNERTVHDVWRIEISAAGDLAYEFSNSTLTYSMADTNEQVTVRGSVLRAWKKEGGEWKVAAMFQMPHNRAPTPRATSPASAAEAQVRAVRADYFPAYYRGDTAALDRMEAEDFTVISPSGRISTVDGRYATIQRQVDAGTWFPAGSRLSDEDLTFRVHGDVVVVHGTAATGTPTDRRQITFTEVWAHRDGAWQFSHIHYHRRQ
jgi:ketosteroid isomerase-like protein